MGYPRILYESRLADAAPAASTTAAGFDVANLTDWRPFTKWQPTALPATVTVDSGAAAAVDYWAVWGHDLASQGATIELRKSNDNFSVNDVLVDTFTPTVDDPFVRYVTTADERYWRLRVTGTTMPTLAIAALGEYLEIPSYLRQGFDPVGREARSSFNRSVAGNPLGRTVDYELWSQAPTFELLSWAWVRDSFLPAWQAHLRGNPFVFSWDPVNYPAELRLVTASAQWAAPHRAGGYADLSLTLEGLVE